MAKKGCAAKKAAVKRTSGTNAWGAAMAAYNKSGCGKRGKKRKTTKKKSRKGRRRAKR